MLVISKDGWISRRRRLLSGQRRCGVALNLHYPTRENTLDLLHIGWRRLQYEYLLGAFGYASRILLHISAHLPACSPMMAIHGATAKTEAPSRRPSVRPNPIQEGEIEQGETFECTGSNSSRRPSARTSPIRHSRVVQIGRPKKTSRRYSTRPYPIQEAETERRSP